jgi:hypothetical protein
MSMLRRILRLKGMLLKGMLWGGMLLVLTLSVRQCTDGLFGPQPVPAPEEATSVNVAPPLLSRRDAVRVARRVDSATVEVSSVKVKEGNRYSATVTIHPPSQGEKPAIALGLRAASPGWFPEFRGRRLDAVAADVMPGYNAEILLVEQPLPLLALEFEPQLGMGFSSRGPALLAAATGLRVSGLHLGGFVATSRKGWSAGGYVSIRPRRHWSLGLGWDIVRRTPHAALTLTL